MICSHELLLFSSSLYNPQQHQPKTSFKRSCHCSRISSLLKYPELNSSFSVPTFHLQWCFSKSRIPLHKHLIQLLHPLPLTMCLGEVPLLTSQIMLCSEPKYSCQMNVSSSFIHTCIRKFVRFIYLNYKYGSILYACFCSQIHQEYLYIHIYNTFPNITYIPKYLFWNKIEIIPMDIHLHAHTQTPPHWHTVILFEEVGGPRSSSVGLSKYWQSYTWPALHSLHKSTYF